MTEEIDEAAIEEEISARTHTIEVDEDWWTPAGNLRKAPLFTAHIQNDFLDDSRMVKARSERELKEKARKQLTTWANREARQRLADAKEDLRDRAEVLNDEVQEELAELRGCLAATLDVDDRVNWVELRELRNFERSVFEPVRPPPEEPARTFLFVMWPPHRKRELAAHAKELANYKAEIAKARAQHDQLQDAKKREFENAKESKNRSIQEFRTAYEAGEPDAVTEYTGVVFERSTYPQRFSPHIESSYEPTSRTVVADAAIPAPSDLSDLAGYKLADRGRRVASVSLSKRDHAALYDEVAKQLALRLIHEALEADYAGHVQAVVVNLWTTTPDLATGHDQTCCILSVQATREVFVPLNLRQVDATECIRNLRGLIAGALSKLAPVQPILTFDRADPRFVESQEQLADLNSRTNLAEIPWEDFEHLVRELLAKMFSNDGAEVRVTRSSRDGGVDAIVFDPEPIRGGKFIVQAKRYTRAVPISAVRDLYGALHNEGASRGILVTTAHYGLQARDFAKDKPLTLIDGSHLVHLLEQHGYPARIDIEAARAKKDA